MDSSSSDRTHRPGTTTTTNTSSELFIGFNSRHSSSSMKFSSKPSILSPARARDPSISLSTSRSRRLRTSGSIKNGQAFPMFPAGGKKRSGGFENPEPSSPKVTCIGQVRVKAKKKGKKIQTLTTRRRSAEVSFRRTEHARHDQIQRQSSVNSQYQQHQEFSSHRNQRWVHLPLTICETLRGFGSEFSCLFPCKPSCFSESSETEKVGGEGNDDGQSPCRALFGRWLVAVQDDGDGGKGRDTEVVVGGADEEEGERPIRSARRHVFDEIEIEDDIFEVKDHEDNDIEGGEGRVSICIPPKNALLLMRCRSDPVKMEALANRFWEPQLPKQEEEDEEAERDNDEDNNRNKEEAVSVEMVEVKDEVAMVQKENLKQVSEEGRKSVSVDINEEEEEEENQPEAEESLEMVVQDNEEDKPIEELQNNEALLDGDQEKQKETEKETQVEEENELGFATLFQSLADEESEEDDENDPMKDKNEDESRVSYSNATFSLQSDQEISEPEEEEEELAEEVALELEYSMDSTVGKETQLKLVEKVTQEEEEAEEEGSTRKTEERETESNAVVERESEAELKKKEERESSSRLPDSLLLMMCEPKLSMEVSKETWVCSTDFIRWKPPVLVKQTDGGDDHADDDETAEKMVSVDANSPLKSCYQPLLKPPRSSCCLPAAVPVATMIEQKLVSAVAYEPFVLTRCKSAPMRTASKKLAPDACFWKNRTLEPHRRATFGIGAAEVGF